MCRWFVYLSATEPALLEDVLVKPDHAITKQVHEHFLPGLVHSHSGETPVQIAAAEKESDVRNKLFSIDGFGVAMYTETAAKYNRALKGPRPFLHKIIMPALKDSTFLSMCANLESKCIFAHIRATTGGAVVPVNNHPFVFGRHVFCHNGEVANFSHIRRAMCNRMSEKFYNMVKGASDSEHIAALYMTHLGDEEQSYTTQEMRTALAKAMKDVHDLQAEQCPDSKEASSLNLAASDGQQLVAVRWRNSATQNPPSLYISTTAGAALNSKFPGDDNQDSGHPSQAVSDHGAQTIKQPVEGQVDGHGLHVIIASEPTTYNENEWRLIEKNHVVTVNRDMHIDVKPMEDIIKAL